MEPSEKIDQQIAGAAGWRGDALARLRRLIHDADPDITEEWKWNTAVFSHGGMVCATAAFADHVKVNFFKGATLKDPHRIINAGLDAKTTRAIDIFEGGAIDEPKFKDLVREAVALNTKK
jgi:hypothetical protein